MNNFKDKIKKLRKKMNLTQEELAERLGVSFQAVSKWETGGALPDITLFPKLANFFDVTTDELLGVDLEKKRARINALLEEAGRLSNQGKRIERFELICDLYREYPNDSAVLDAYVKALFYDPRSEEGGWITNAKEIASLCKRILKEETQNEKRRCEAIDTLANVYYHNGEKGLAEEYIQLLPDEMQKEGREFGYTEWGSEEWFKVVRSNIFDSVNMLAVRFRNIAGYSNLPPMERAEIYQKAVSLIKLVYDKGDYGFENYTLSELYGLIANRYIQAGDHGNALKNLEYALHYAKEYDSLPERIVHTSVLVEGHVTDMTKTSSGHEGNYISYYINELDNEGIYEPLRKTKEFGKLVEKYRPFASNKKPWG